LLADAADVVVAHLVEQGLLFLSLDGISLAVNNRVRSHDAEGFRVRLDDLELDGAHAAANHEDVSLADRTICLQEIWLQVNIENVAS